MHGVKYPVGAPPPYPLPVHALHWGKHSSLFSDDFSKKSRGVIGKYGITTPKIRCSDDCIDPGYHVQPQPQFLAKGIPGHCWTSQFVVAIEADWTPNSPTTWEKAVREIKT
ncbi:Fc.00g012640.m01.CDS01 [Cosmosporella sp. VM-42]